LGPKGLTSFWTELTELTKLADHQELGYRRAAVGLLLSDASISSVISVSSVVILFRFFTSFVSFAVFRLSFSSFCCPSVDTGCMASLPSLGLIVFLGNWVQKD
jgi:hypothetical protein